MSPPMTHENVVARRAATSQPFDAGELVTRYTSTGYFRGDIARVQCKRTLFVLDVADACCGAPGDCDAAEVTLETDSVIRAPTTALTSIDF